jgi:hypothetical protein
VKTGPDLTFNSGLTDAFVAKVNPTGTSLEYCGYIGGGDEGCGSGIAIDAAGNAYVTGWTKSDEKSFPVKVGPDLTYNGGVGDAFVAKVNAQGTALVYCGYIGGDTLDESNAIAVDKTGCAFVTGNTMSDEKSFPVKIGPDLSYNGGTLSFAGDAFVAKIKADGSGLDYCGYIGGRWDDTGLGIAVNAEGQAIVGGVTQGDETTFPVCEGPSLVFKGGQSDLFVARVSAQGAALESCGFVGGLGQDGWAQTFVYSYYEDGDLAVDSSGNAYLTSYTDSPPASFVKVGPGLVRKGSGVDAFVAKVSFTLLRVRGATRPGSTIDLDLTASDSPGLPYCLGSSLSTGPIPLDKRTLGLGMDALLMVSVSGAWPAVFSGYHGRIGAQGKATAAIHIPAWPSLVGLKIHTAFVTLDPAAPSGVKSISDTFSFPITAN